MHRITRLITFASPFGLSLALAVAAQAEPVAEEVETREKTSLEVMREAADADANTRYGLLDTISPRGASQKDRAEIVKLLTEQLNSDYADIRARAARVLSLFGGDAAPAIPAMMKLIGDEEPTVNLEAVWVPVSKALSHIGPEHALKSLMDALDETFQVDISKNEQSGEYVVDWGDRAMYYGITGAIAGMGEGAAETAPVFIHLLRNGPENRRWATMYTLAQLGEAAAPAIPDLIANLDHRDFNFKVMACRALAKHGAKSAMAAPKLIKLMEKNGNLLSTRTHAAMCLGAIGPVDGIDLVKLFEEMIKEPNAFSQERGLVALGRLGEYAKESREFVEGLLNDTDFSQKPEAARTLWQITGKTERTFQVLEELIDNPTYDTRVFGVLRDMGPAAAPISKLVADRLKTEDQSMRQLMLEILVGMGESAKEHLDAIRGALDDAAPDTAVAIEKAIAKIEASSE